jgi:hypothetical protein
MYTSVHYIIGSGSQTPLTCEIQVRTLMEEVWGEVDHKINYPILPKMWRAESRYGHWQGRRRAQRGLSILYLQP